MHTGEERSTKRNSPLVPVAAGINSTWVPSFGTVLEKQEGPAQAHIQALNLTEGMCAPAMTWLA